MDDLMARRLKRKSTRRTRNYISLGGLAETYIIGSAGTKLFFGTDLVGFLTGVTHGSSAAKGGRGFFPNEDGASRISLVELLGFSQHGWSASNVGGNYGAGGSFTKAVTDNVSANLIPSAMTMILTPIAFKFGRRLMRKPITMTNRLLKGSGIKV